MNKERIDGLFQKIMTKGKCRALKEECERVVREKPEDNDWLIKDFEHNVKTKAIYYALEDWCKLAPVDWFDDSQEKYVINIYGFEGTPTALRLPSTAYSHLACASKECLEEFIKRVNRYDLQLTIASCS